MRERARSARPRSVTRRHARRRVPKLRRSCRLQLLLLRPDRAQPLMEPGPRPRLDFLVADLELAPGCLEVLEPGVRLLDQQELVCVAVARHAESPPRRIAQPNCTAECAAR